MLTKNRVTSLPRLTKGVSKDYRPAAGERFYNPGNDALEVFQVLTEKDENGDVIYIALTQDKRDWLNGLTFMVITPLDMVDGAVIAEGVYEYMGIQTYETKEHRQKTVRVFAEVLDDKVEGK